MKIFLSLLTAIPMSDKNRALTPGPSEKPSAPPAIRRSCAPSNVSSLWPVAPKSLSEEFSATEVVQPQLAASPANRETVPLGVMVNTSYEMPIYSMPVEEKAMCHGALSQVDTGTV